MNGEKLKDDNQRERSAEGMPTAEEVRAEGEKAFKERYGDYERYHDGDWYHKNLNVWMSAWMDCWGYCLHEQSGLLAPVEEIKRLEKKREKAQEDWRHAALMDRPERRVRWLRGVYVGLCTAIGMLKENDFPSAEAEDEPAE